MTSPAALSVFRWCIWETLRQSLASRVFWLMLGPNALAIAFCLSVGVDGEALRRLPDDIELYDTAGRPLTGPNPTPGHLTVAFGAVRVPLFRDGSGGVQFVEAVLARWVAGAA